MSPLPVTKQPFGKRVRTIYTLLALFNLLTLGAIAYLNIHLGMVETETRLSNERWAARIAILNRLEHAAAAVDVPGNDVFASGDIPAEKRRLDEASVQFHSAINDARSGPESDPQLLKEINDVELAMQPMLRESSEVFRLLGVGAVGQAGVAMARLDRAYTRLQRELDDVKGVSRRKQLAEFSAQSDRSRRLAREQKIGLGLMMLLVLATFGYGRLLDREVVSAGEREKYLRTLKEREEALRKAGAERDEQREELLREQQLMSDAERLAGLGAFELDLRANKLWWSEVMFSLFGVKPGEFEPSYDKFLEMVHPADRSLVSASVERSMATRTPFSFDLRIVAADGKERILATFGRIDLDDQGQPLRIRGIAQDITERKWAEEQLLRQEAQLAEAQRVARIGSWELDIQTRAVTWSDELHEILGYGSGEVQPSFKAYMSLVPPGENRRVYRLLEKAVADQSRFEFEHTLVRKDGAEVVMLVRGVIDRDAENKPVRILGVSQDVTARKKSEDALRISEERFQLASRATNDIVWDWSPADDSLWVSEGFSTRFGHPSWGNIDIQVWYRNIHPDDLDRIDKSIHAAIESTAKDWSGEYRFRDGAGLWHEVLDRGYIVRDGAGKAVRVIGAMMDVTERRAVERMKDEFISTVSHELRTPLTSIRGALGLLSSGRLGALPEKGQRLLEIASSNTDRLVRLINDILDIERIESGKVTLAKVNCDGADLVRHAADIIRSLADRERISIAVNARSSPLVADADRIIQTLTNLLGNAVKFSPPGSTVTVTAEPRGHDVVFTVADRGRGIPAGKLSTIFERFQQVDASDAREKGGSGLGLAISRSIVRQHGGEISVESEPEKGSTFTIVIPSGIPTAQPEENRSDGKLIYVCDDDSDARNVLKFFLAERGYRVREMATGRDLMDALTQEKPDAILLDLFMPDMNGWETLARLKSDPETSGVPVIVVSILSPDETGATGLELSGWVQKPLEERALAGVIDRAFRQKARRPRLVLVEDDADLASVIIASFERYGIETIHARTGDEAIEIARRVDPDLLILDLILPGVDGYGVIDWLKDHEVWRGLPLVVYSATEPSPSQRERLQLGHTEFMTKSRVAPEEFERRIVSLLDALTAKTGMAGHVA